MANLNKKNKALRKGANKDKRKTPENRKRNQKTPETERESYEDGGVCRNESGATEEEAKEGKDNILGVVRRR
jgi:hypothetical protein